MGDWRVKYDGVCSRCGIALRAGEVAVYDRPTRTIHCVSCPAAPAPEPPELDASVAGRSARREHERRAAKREAAVRGRRGDRLGGVVLALTDEPQSTRAWAIGARGEEKLAKALDGFTVLHDRQAPGTRGNIDHIVIAPAGVFVVDAKNNQRRIEIRDRGSFFRTDYRLIVAGRDYSAMADKMGWQVDAVRSTLEAHGIEAPPPITPVLCFLNVEWPLLGAPESFRGVRIESHRSIKGVMTTSVQLTEPRTDHLVAVLSEALPPK